MSESDENEPQRPEGYPEQVWEQLGPRARQIIVSSLNALAVPPTGATITGESPSQDAAVDLLGTPTVLPSEAALLESVAAIGQAEESWGAQVEAEAATEGLLREIAASDPDAVDLTAPGKVIAEGVLHVRDAALPLRNTLDARIVDAVGAEVEEERAIIADALGFGENPQAVEAAFDAMVGMFSPPEAQREQGAPALIDGPRWEGRPTTPDDNEAARQDIVATLEQGAPHAADLSGAEKTATAWIDESREHAVWKRYGPRYWAAVAWTVSGQWQWSVCMAEEDGAADIGGAAQSLEDAQRKADDFLLAKGWTLRNDRGGYQMQGSIEDLRARTNAALDAAAYRRVSEGGSVGPSHPTAGPWWGTQTRWRNSKANGLWVAEVIPKDIGGIVWQALRPDRGLAEAGVAVSVADAMAGVDRALLVAGWVLEDGAGVAESPSGPRTPSEASDDSTTNVERPQPIAGGWYVEGEQIHRIEVGSKGMRYAARVAPNTVRAGNWKWWRWTAGPPHSTDAAHAFSGVERTKEGAADAADRKLIELGWRLQGWPWTPTVEDPERVVVLPAAASPDYGGAWPLPSATLRYASRHLHLTLGDGRAIAVLQDDVVGWVSGSRDGRNADGIGATVLVRGDSRFVVVVTPELEVVAAAVRETFDEVHDGMTVAA